MHDALQRGRLILGAQWFAVLSVAGLGVLFVATGGATVEAVSHLSPLWVALSCVTAVLDLLIGAYRYQIFLAQLRPGSPFLLPIRADLANRFVGAVTPSQTGGGPGQLYVLFKGGVPVPDSLSLLAINFLSTMIFFILAGGWTAWMFRGEFTGGGVVLLVRYGFVAFAAMGAFVGLALIRPDLIVRPCRAIVARRGDGSTGPAGIVHRGATWVIRNVSQYDAATKRFLRGSPWLVVWSFLLTIVLYVNKFTLGYCVLRGLGVQAPYLEVLAVQALLNFIMYVAPTPGGSGIAELITAALMARFMDPQQLAVFTTAFRFFLMYLPAAAGCLVLIAALKPEAAPEAPVQPVLEVAGGEAG